MLETLHAKLAAGAAETNELIGTIGKKSWPKAIFQK
jgi:hypothetical protein